MAEEQGASGVKRILEKWSRRPAAAAIYVGLVAVLLQPLYLAVAGAFTPFPKIGCLLWVAWVLVMGPGITLFTRIVPGVLSPIMVTLASLVIGAVLWGGLAYALLKRYPRTEP